MATYNRQVTIYNALRQAFRSNPVKKQCLREAISPIEQGPRGGAFCICAKCGLAFSMKDVQVDHINPVIPLNKTIQTMTWDRIIDNLFCSIDNLQVLCRPCHEFKCNDERTYRLDYKHAQLML